MTEKVIIERERIVKVKVGVPGPKGDKGDTGLPGTTTWDGITDKPATFPPSDHNHDGDYDPAGTAASTVTGHEAAVDPHPQYQTQDEGDARYSQLGHAHPGVYDPDGTAAAAVAAHEMAADPHTQYMTQAEGDSAYEPKNPNIQEHIASTANPHGTTAAQVGAYTTAQVDTLLVGKQDALGYVAENAANRGQPLGYATLDATGLVPASQLPSYVDDVIEYEDFAAFPVPGEGGKIYIDLDTGYQYRWTGSTYQELPKSPGTTDAVPEGSSNLYHTAARVRDTVLTGLSLVSTSVISAADTVLSALGRLQAQITANHASDVQRSNHTGTQTASTISDFAPAAQSAAPAETTTTTGALINSAAEKTAPVDADMFAMRNSVTGLLGKFSWASLKAAISALTNIVTSNDVGTAPNTIPINAYLGALAYRDHVGLQAQPSSAPTLASAATIQPQAPIVFVSGTTAIDTITPPLPFSEGGGQITLIPTGLWTTTTAGNIALSSTSVVGRTMTMTYDAVTMKWYPSY